MEKPEINLDEKRNWDWYTFSDGAQKPECLSIKEMTEKVAKFGEDFDLASTVVNEDYKIFIDILEENGQYYMAASLENIKAQREKQVPLEDTIEIIYKYPIPS